MTVLPANRPPLRLLPWFHAAILSQRLGYSPAAPGGKRAPPVDVLGLARKGRAEVADCQQTFKSRIQIGFLRPV
jgi:hypothetical protein